MTNTQPRLLVVCSAPMGGGRGTAITLHNLLGGWPLDRCRQIYTVEASDPAPDGDYFYAPRNAPIDFYARRMLTRRDDALEWGAPTNPGVPAQRGTQPVRARLHSQMRALADMTPIHIPRDLVSWIRAFQPELVYSLLGNIRMMTLATAVADLAGVPLVPHFMDDWPTTLYSGGEVLGRARTAVEAGLRDVIRRAPVGLAISDDMSEEYSDRFGIPFLTFGNTVAPPIREPGPDGAVRDSGAILEFMYVGGLHLERWRSLAALGEALEELNKAAPVARLVVHAPDSDLSEFGALFGRVPAIHMGGSLSPAEVSARIATADVLVHVESFDERIRKFTRLSLSTKIPQYLASGRPILAIGPPELASIRHIGTVGAGVLVTTAGPAPLRDGVAELVRSTGVRDELGHRGAVYAMKHYCRDAVRDRFVATLRTAATRPG